MADRVGVARRLQALQDAIEPTGPRGRIRGDRAPPRAHHHAEAGAGRPAAARPSALAAPKLRGRAEPRPEHPQLLDHRPHRPWEVDAGRSHPRDHRRGRLPRPPPAAARLDGPRARARHHDQGPGGARGVRGARRRDLPPAPDRHARPRGLHLRGVALAGGVRRRAAGGRRGAGRRGPDGRQHLPRRGRRPRADPGAEQDRPARAPSPSAWPARSRSCSASPPTR